tara:strand:+ start:557 stop:766 length:210 start_codon:yes stop_codon:yes gene_type:complete
VKVGDLVKFDRINGHTTDINDKVAVYLGEAFIHRDDGVVVQNHKVLLLGKTTPTIIGVGLLRWLRKYPE